EVIVAIYKRTLSTCVEWYISCRFPQTRLAGLKSRNPRSYKNKVLMLRRAFVGRKLQRATSKTTSPMCARKVGQAPPPTGSAPWHTNSSSRRLIRRSESGDEGQEGCREP